MWSTAGNWSDSAPSISDPTPLLVFSTASPGFSTATGFASTNDVVGLVGVTIQLTDTSPDGDFAIGGNSLATAAGGITSNVSTGVGATFSFGGTGITLEAPQSFVSTAGLLTVNSAIANGTFDLTANAATNMSIALAGNIGSGSGGIIKSGAGLLTLSGSNTYTGATNISAGTLRISADNNLGAAPGSPTAGSLTIATTATLSTTASFTLNSNRGISLPSGTANFSPGVATTLVYGGIIAGNGGLQQNLNGGTLALSGQSTYTGATTLVEGATIRVDADVPGTAIPGPLGNSTATISYGGNGTAILLGGTNVTFSRPISIVVGVNSGAGRGIGLAAGTLAGTFAGNLTIASGFPKTVTVSTGGTLTISGNISGSAVNGFTLQGAGTIILSGANSFDGNVSLGNGTTLSVASIGNAPSGSTSNLGSPTTAALGQIVWPTNGIATLLYTGSGETTNRQIQVGNSGQANAETVVIDSSGTGTIVFSAAGFAAVGKTGSTIILKGTGNGQFTGNMAGFDFGSLTIAGSGIWTLSAANTNTGTTTVSSGTLAYGINDALNTGAVTVNGGTLNLGAFTDSVGTVTLSSGAITGTTGVLTSTTTAFAVQSGTLGAKIGSANGLTKSTSGTVTLTGQTFAYTGATTINGGSLVIASSASVTSTSSVSGTTSGALYVNGSLTTAGGATIGAATALAGNSTITAATSISAGGTLAPGATANTPGILTNSGTLGIAGRFYVDINGGATPTVGTDYDQAVSTGNVTLTTATASLILSGTNTSVTPGEVLVILKNNSGNGVTGTFANLPEGAKVSLNGRLYSISYAYNAPGSDGQANDIALTSLASTSYYLDSDGDATGDTGVVGGGSVTWDASSTIWRTGNPDGSFNPSGTLVSWATANASGTAWAVFAGTAGTVTVSSVTPVYLSFQVSGYSVTNPLAYPTVAPFTADAVTIDVAANQTATISSLISGTIGLTKLGTGTLTLSGANTFTGTNTIVAGTIQIDADTRLGNAANSVIIKDGILATTASFTLANTHGVFLEPATLPGTGTVNVATGTTLGYGGILANLVPGSTGGFTKSGTGTLSLSGANTYSGATTLAAGTLTIDSDARLGSAPSAPTPGNLVINGGSTLNIITNTVNLNSNRGVTLVSGDIAFINNTTQFTIGGIVAGAGNLIKGGGATMILSGINTYSGSTTVNLGVLQISTDAGLGTAPGAATPGSIVINGGTLESTGTFTLNANRGIALGPTSGAGTGTFSISNGNTLTFNGIIANNGSGSGTLAKSSGTGSLTLGGINTYSGGTTISAGLVQISADANLGAAPGSATPGNIVVNSVAGSNAALEFNGTFTLNANRGLAVGPATGAGVGSLSVTTGNTISYAGIIANNGGGVGGLTKTSSGVFIPSGNNTYTGSTTINGGTIEITSDANLGAVPGAPTVANITLNAGGRAAFLRTVGDFTLNSNRGIDLGTSVNNGGTLNIVSGTLSYAGNMTGSAPLEKTGNGTLVLSGTNDYAKNVFITTTISAGTLRVSGGNAIPDSSAVSVANNATFELTSNESIYFLTGNNAAAAVKLNANTLTVGMFNGSETTNGYGGGIYGTGGITKVGTGTLRVNNNSNTTYSGATTINGGTLDLRTTLLNSAVVLANSGTAILAVNGSITIGSLAGGGGGGAGGNVTLGANFLSVGSDGTTTAFAGNIVGTTGGVTKIGAGILTLSGANSYTGATTLNGGTLSVSGGNALPDLSQVTLANTAGVTLDLAANETVGSLAGGGATGGNVTLNANTLTVGGLAATTFSGTISGSGGLTKADSNSLTLALQTSGYTGATTVTGGNLTIAANATVNATSSVTISGAGTLFVNGSLTPASGPINVSSGGILAGGVTTTAGNVNAAVSIASSGAVAPGGGIANATGILNINGNLTLAGRLYVEINGTTAPVAGTDYDQVAVTTGTVDLTGSSLFLTGSNTTITAANKVVLLKNSGGVTLSGTFTGLAEGATVSLNNRFYTINYNVDSGDGSLNDVVLTSISAASTSYYWDADSAGGGTGGSGTWNTTDLVWRTGNVDGTFNAAGTLVDWATANASGIARAVFQGTAGNVAIDPAVTAAYLSFTLTGFTLTGSLALAGSGVIDATTGTTTINAVISNSGGSGLTKIGGGSLVLGGVNTYSGPTIIAAGTLTTNNATSTGAIPNASPVFVSGTLNLTASETIGSLQGNQATFGAVTLNANTLTTGGDNTSTIFGGNISGASGALTKAGSGTMLLSGSNSYTGNTTINGGILAITGGAAIADTSAVVLANTAGVALNLLNSNETIGSLAGGGATGGNINIGAMTLTVGTTDNANTNTTTAFGGNITGTTGAFTKNGTGTLTLSGTNTYNGTTTISVGTLTVSGGNALPDTGLVTFANTAGAILNVSANETVGSITGGGTTGGNITLNGNTLSIGSDNTSPAVYAGVISGTNGNLTKVGAGTLILSGANTYTGVTTINSGILQVNASVALSTAGPLGNAASAVLLGDTTGSNAAGLTINVNNGTMTRALTVQSGSSGVKTIGFTSGSGSMSGGITLNGSVTFDIVNSTTLDILTGLISGGGSLTKINTGTLGLSAANTYTGTTSVLNGTLRIGANAPSGGNGALGNATSAVLLGDTSGSNSATLSINGAFTVGRAISVQSGSSGAKTIAQIAAGPGIITGNIALNASAIFDVGSGNTLNVNTGVISGAGNLTKTSVGALVLGGLNTYTGSTTIAAGSVSVASIGNVGATNSNLGAQTTASAATIAIGTTNTTGTLIYTGTGETSDRVIDLAGTTGGATIDQSGASGLLKFTSNLTATGAGSKMLTLQGSTVNGTGEISGNIVNNSGSNITFLTKTGSGTWTVSGANTYAGVTAIAGGTLRAASIGSVGSTSSSLGAPTTVANGTITIGSGATAVSLVYTGTGETTDRVIDLSGTTGGVTLDQSGVSGLLKFTSNFTASGAGSKTVTLQGSAGGTAEIASSIVEFNSGNTTAITKSGSGTWILSGSNSYSGATTVSVGVLNIRHANALGNTVGGTSVTSGAALEIQGGITTASEALTLNGAGISSGGALRNVLGDNTYAGLITLGATGVRINSDSGTLALSNPGTITGAAFTLTVGGSGNTSIASIIGTTTGTLTKDGTGTLTLSGANTYSGVTTINAGTVQVNANVAANAAGPLGNAATAVLLGATSGSASASLVMGVAGLSIGRSITVQAGSSGIKTLGYTPATGTGTITGAIALNAAATLDVANGGTLTISTGGMSGVGGLSKAGTGSAVLAGSTIAYTGATAIDAGSLELQDATAFASTSITDNSALILNRTTGTQTFTVPISGSGTLQKTGAGTVTLGGATGNTYNGLTTVSEGTLLLSKSSGNAIGGDLTIGDADGNVETVQLTQSNQIADGSIVTVNSNGLLDFNGRNDTIAGLNGNGSVSIPTVSVPSPDGAVAQTTFTNDAGTDISSSKTYTHVLDFGPDASAPTVNGVAFTPVGLTGAGFSTSGSDTTHSGSGGPVAITATGNIVALLTDFIYKSGGGTEAVTLTGLTIGVQYETRFYIRRWDVANRTQTFSFDPDGAGPTPSSVYATFDEDASATASYFGYRFTAAATQVSFSAAMSGGNTANSFHFYGLSNEVVPNLSGTSTLTLAGTGTYSFSGSISGAGNLVQQGIGGTQTLGGANTYTGTTNINAGKLLVNGSIAGAGGDLTATGVDSILGGTGGDIDRAVTITGGATLAPGSSIGTLGVNANLTLLGVNSFEVTGGSGPLGASDKVDGINALAYTGVLKITNAGGAFAGGDSWDLFDFTSQSGSFDNNVVFGTSGDGVNLPSLSGGLLWQFNYATGVLSIFSPLAAPTVTSIVPAIGPTTGGTMLLINGSNFVSITTVTIAGTPLATFSVSGTTQITVTTPAHAAGAVDVVVTNAGGSGSLVGTSDFTYATPAVASVVVNGGPGVVLGGSTWSLAGQNSVVKQILVTFNQAVTLASDAFTVTPVPVSLTPGPGVVLVNGGAAPSSAAVTATIAATLSPSSYLVTFSGPGTHAGGGINSGVYDLTTIASKVSANSETMASNRVDTFFAMFGTINANDSLTSGTIGDGFSNAFVDPGSLFQFSDAFGSSAATPVGPPAYNIVFDSNLDGFIDPGDLFAFSDAFGIDWDF